MKYKKLNSQTMVLNYSLSRNSRGGTEENHETSPSEQSVSRSWFEYVSARI